MNAPETAVAVAALPIDAIGPSPTNPRKHFDDAYLAELAETIKSHGVLQPITVRPNPRGLKPLYEIVVGECRWRAAKLAGLAEIPAFWRELDDRQVLEIQIIENLQRRDVHPLEEAEGYDRLMKTHGYQAEQIAGKIGKSRSYVYARLKLCALCKPAREAFFAGTLDASTALLVARIPGDKEQKRAIKEITEGYGGRPMSYRDAQRHLRHKFALSLKQATFPPDDATLLPAAGACSACPKRSGNDRDLFGDIEEADVCTDPPCFEQKRLARHDQLIALAEKKQIPVLRGEAAHDVMPNGPWSLDEERYVNLDEQPQGDPELRSFREILGKATPVAALIEYNRGSEKHLVEVAEPKALEAALLKAGWAPLEGEEKPEDENDPTAAARHAAAAAKVEERRRSEAAAEAESERRGELYTRVFAQFKEASLGEADTLEQLLRLFAETFLRREIDEQMGIDDEELLARWGLPQLPEEYDYKEEGEKLIAALRDWRINDVFGFLFDWLSYTERNVGYYNYEARPPMLEGLAEFFGIGADAPPAAPAKARKAAKKAKAEAAPVAATGTLARTEWPFPTGARP